MSEVTFIHTSDLQLGMTRAFLPAEAQARFDAARLEAVVRIGRIAQERQAEFIVVAGDVFEHNALESRTLGRALEMFKALPVPVYLLPGNHDPLVADSIFSRTESLDNVHVLRTFDVVEVRPGVELVGAPLKAKHASEDLVAKALRPLEPTAAIRIAVGHGQAEARTADVVPDLIDVAAVEEKLADGTIDYLALGDTHSTMSLGTSGRVWYSGSPETTDFHDHAPGVAGNESDSGNALVVTARKGSAEVEKVRTGGWTFDALHWEVDGADDVDKLLAELSAYPDKERTVVKYSMSGTLGLEETSALETGLAQLEPVFAALYERSRLMDLHLEPGDGELAGLPLTGFAAAAMSELVEAAADNPVARDAVNLLFRLSKES
ncbi:exonuclease subunit SbcD [Corynebacterium capitovis DSM 44611]|uniref:metallophosphoesterase family protein n=1 Tax=Corynebacterium capitovis TaxID=131081 RepID=UPI0003A72B03|nr:exonuclease SbcCD subunit D [Corynebacterium capitovis]WKD57856.1 exonuclease subunit SbcD [Corynebacterium capitovis DSM 44611]